MCYTGGVWVGGVLLAYFYLGGIISGNMYRPPELVQC